MKIPRFPLLLAALTLLAVSSVHAQTPFDLVLISKSREFVKNTATGPVPATGNPFGNLGFEVTVSGPSFGSGITAPVVTLGSGSTYPSANPSVHDGGTLYFNSDGEWGYGSPDGEGIAMSSNLNVYFSQTTAYNVNVLGNNVSLNFNSSAFPIVPDFIFSQGTWSNGTLLFDPTQNLTITIGNLGGFKSGTSGTTPDYDASGVGGHVNLFLRDGSTVLTDQDLFSRVGPPGATFTENPGSISYTLTANALNAGKTFFGEGIFQTMTDYNTTGGYTNVALMESMTSFSITAIPEPSTYAAMASALALGLAAWHRRRRPATA